MFVPVIVLIAALLMMWAELRRPGRHWPRVKGWWGRALVFNGLQAGIVYAFGMGFEAWLENQSLWKLAEMGTLTGTIVGYLVMTFLFYWWHRARHEIPFLWRWLHQLHHSPQRLEIITSFYKHPFEILANTVFSSVVMYLVMGLSPASAAGVALLAGLAELFYHWNVKTPHWMGYIIQRPESHCVHHQEGVHGYNYGDLPIWDMMFGTFNNPKTFEDSCGLGSTNEHKLGRMLLGCEVNDETPVSYSRRLTALAFVGLFGMAAYASNVPELKGLAAFTTASPSPKVFTTVDGLETFSTKFWVTYTDENGPQVLEVTKELYPSIQGPYNRRNVYGGVLAYGPVLATNPTTKPMYDAAAQFALCPGGRGDAKILRELGIRGEIHDVEVHYAPKEGTPESIPRVLRPDCGKGDV